MTVGVCGASMLTLQADSSRHTRAALHNRIILSFYTVLARVGGEVGGRQVIALETARSIRPTRTRPARIIHIVWA
jgi:hypothetical protein